MLYYDNESTIKLAANSIVHRKTKHIKVNCHSHIGESSYGDHVYEAYFILRLQHKHIDKVLRISKWHFLLGKFGMYDLYHALG